MHFTGNLPQPERPFLLGEAVALLVSKRLPEILRKLPEYRAGKYKARGQIMSRAQLQHRHDSDHGGWMHWQAVLASQEALLLAFLEQVTKNSLESGTP